ncbi:hypothetical protein AB0E12_25400 [Micromonospora chersina]|uniref:hypothetical protein n=1 Tax=Micromonospora chersina TaxID=47854 RepID=UPI0034089572
MDTTERRRKSLGRLVAHENSASDLLAFLIEMDSRPLAGLLGLEDGLYSSQREVKATGAGQGRLDLVVRRQPDDHPVAVLEMKGASSVHGDQLDRYDAWARSFDPAPKRFYCTLDGDGDVPPDPWQPLSLVELFAAWQASKDSHAAWLAREIADVLRSWDAEADGIIGSASGWYVPDLVSRRTAGAVDGDLRRAHHDGSKALASRTNAGNPMFVAWRRHPRGSKSARVGVDVRSNGRGTPSQPWLFRPCVDVYGSGQSQRDARLEAHDLAVALRPAMMLPVIRDVLATQGHTKLADALQVDQRDGLRGPADPAVLDEWRTQIASGNQPSRRHPVFYNDRGLRLATQLRLDVTQLTRYDLADLTVEVLDHLVKHA